MLLASEVNKWHWVITWDNPVPPNSSKMLAALGRLGKLTSLQTKTTVLLAPRKFVSAARIRRVIVAHLHPMKGNAVYVNLRTKNAWHYGKVTGHHWQKVN
ncbi:hypothetical protein [Rhodopseudomonas sp. RCAM05734]|uniref:hypothetical protein n=1 Tax=Rhodopseudomonas sp. RCAM05734 TaxID=3457549 RepID=UPI004044BA6D